MPCKEARARDEVEILVEFYGGFREAVGTDRLSFNLSGGKTVEGLLKDLAAHYGARFQAALLDGEDTLKHDAVLLLNRAVLTTGELSRTLKKGDHLTLFQTISGG